jgi:DNA mismatch repair ATPase MutS
MMFPSIVHARPEGGPAGEAAQAPAYFSDLNLDQIVKAITTGKEEYDLADYFYRPLRDVDAVAFRHEVWRDLENHRLSLHVRSFATRMHSVRQHLDQASKLHYRLQKESWFLDEAEIYCDAVRAFARDLDTIELRSRGLLAFHRYLSSYAESDRFTAFAATTKKLRADLDTVKYAVLVTDGGFTVRSYENESNYSTEVERSFEKFKQGAVKSYAAKFSDLPGMNHIEAKILEFVARLHPEIFRALGDFCVRNASFLDDAIVAFDRDVQFYIAYQDYISGFKRAGLNFCFPTVSRDDKEELSQGSFDLALAGKLAADKVPIVCNDYYLTGDERILVVSGPNQGGKTTFARTFGQLHHLASLGCPVPGSEARLFLFDRLFTHFEKEEDIATLRGKLADDLFRVHKILAETTSHSIVIMNEIFTSTTLNDAVSLGRAVIQKISDRDALCVCVTFLDELASLNDKTVSMVSTVVPDNPAQRTFKVVRQPADGLSYAISIAEKYRLTYERVKERIPS